MPPEPARRLTEDTFRAAHSRVGTVAQSGVGANTAALFLRVPQDAQSTDFAEHAILAANLMNAPTCDVLYVAITMQGFLPYNVFLDPAWPEVRTVAELLALDHDGYLVVLGPSGKPHARRLSTLPTGVSEGAVALSRAISKSRSRSTGFDQTVKVLLQQAAPIGVPLAWTKLTADDALATEVERLDVPAVGGEFRTLIRNAEVPYHGTGVRARARQLG